ncbi:hypothetical protein FPV67DRAFT_1469893 [Lyophyllum atratum]|nr:hypothetical protein FPV67DRAFT_1469893 [Lyophyllum atratum]
MSMSTTLKPLLDGLQVPADYARYENISDDTVLARLDEWKCSADHILQEIRSILKQQASELSIPDQANVVSAAAPFDSQDPWTTETLRSVAEDILQHFSNPQPALLSQILTHNVKPLFQLNPHPSLNASGRKLARPAGGPMASQDFYDAQTWKTSPGVVNLVSWCVRHIPRDAYEGLWHLIIPPVMALLDDYEARYKLQGVEIVSQMLQHVPGQLLKRTGVEGLIRSSLNTCLTHLNNPETPQLIEAAVAASLSLTFLTTSAGSADHFDQLCALLGEGIISGIWLYAADRPDVLLASLEALPPVLRALSIGNARFLKALITQLVYSLKPNPVNPWPADIQITSLRVLTILIEECAPCIPRWKITILDGVARCWVTLKDSGTDNPVLDAELRHTCEVLKKNCPSVIEVEYKRLIAYDRIMFGDLLGMSEQ